jgi:broad specificity phosphatase PhoE
MDVWLVRHGETEWSRSGKHTGRTDVPLLDEGRTQAVAAGRWLADVVPDPALVLTSPLVRAAETCRLAGLGDRAEVTDDLSEWDYGDYDGRTTEEIRAERPGWSVWEDGVPGGESPSDIGRRADRVIARVRAVEGPVVVFSHGHLLRVLGARWVGLPPVGGRVFALWTGAICALGWERETAVVTRWNLSVDTKGPEAREA